jgi:porphobilinogen synthase
MSFSTLVNDMSFRGANEERRQARGVGSSSTIGDDRRSHVSRAMSYASTTATSVSISGDISSQLHGGYSHPLARSWQAERQLTKVCTRTIPSKLNLLTCASVYAHLPTLHLGQRK